MLTLRARRLFDGHDLLEDRVVHIQDGKIVEVTAGGSADVDLGDVMLLPGFIDCHVHLAFDAGLDPVASLDRPGLADRMREAARAHLRAGVTTVRDLGDREYLALRLGLGVAEGPDILAAGPPLTSKGGHCWWLGGEVGGEEGIREAVREHHRRGVHAIKMMVTGGQMTEGSQPHLTQFTLEEIKAAADEAHACGLPIAGHAHGGEGIAFAVAAGFDTIEHCAFWTEHSAEPDLAVIAEIAASSTIVSLTAGLIPVEGVAPPPDLLERLPKLIEVMQLLYRGGVKWTIGTDAGIAPVKPHGMIGHGAKMLVGLGYAPLDVLRAITATAAAACRVEDRKGRIAAGYDADLVAVSGDPLSDITALLAPFAVYHRGERVAL
ncbi:amidohydrolase family protein [Nonomuraea sp. NBC_01738]|uniref:amidohydrolase family protein n=1 Tax=Nonomuraea sp. NBC_01738 TaxID=2976003 RepID=UPI002E13D240|nr:amidohydrolase family protein [Nonomuraea sp. NBC_01738]